jgi:hypothetical protein
LATSTTKTDPKSDSKAFVTLRFAGNELDPREISAILPVEPTRAHRKGEEFFAGPNAGTLRGRTGMWFLATDKLVDSDDLADHLAFVQRLLYSAANDSRRIGKLREVLDRTHSRAHVTCFWRGDPSETAPEIPDRFKAVVEQLAADIETDYGVPIREARRSEIKNRGKAMKTVDEFAQALEAIDLSEPTKIPTQWELLNCMAAGLDVIFAHSRTPALREIEGLHEAFRYLEISMGGAPSVPSVSGATEAARDELVDALTAGAEVGVKTGDEEELRRMGKQFFAERIQALKNKLPTF